MYETLQPVAEDPILALMASYRRDTNSNKLDLGIGVYKDEQGQTPIMQAVSSAERLLLERETSKSYIGPAGSEGFNRLITQLVFGADHRVIGENRVVSAQTPGGCGALRIGAELLAACSPTGRIWVSDPTWANHRPLLAGAGLEIREYPYYDSAQRSIRFGEMIDSLNGAEAGDIVLLHGCCHNPTGADLEPEQWRQLAELIERRGLLPFVDIAYQGLGDGLDRDAYGVRYLAEQLPEMMVVTSCSKNFGLYRERTGALFLIGRTPAQTERAGGQLFSRIRGHYSMPPAHGGAVVETILDDTGLTALWQSELSAMRERIRYLRHRLVDRLEQVGVNGDFGHIRHQRGMFSFLGIEREQVVALRKQHSVYLVESGRFNVAGLSNGSIDAFVAALAQTVGVSPGYEMPLTSTSI
ncbi:aminotransferase [Marinobacterium zhoushanense]|uniref:Aminotransferase n=1 Tax=Marinobacterium zhoushanense TaxID=1679163 RepID=A0ABQ1K4C1_9GAMM|nr:amino acid aminotransferase [Marinobacterium zhoushanense]GGB84065.1 aminotransferase [Marinobacterium zhoushanense]